MGEASNLWAWFWFGYVVMCLIFAWVGFLVGRTKGRERLGGWLGLLLGPFGVLAVGLMEPTQEVLSRRAGGQAAARSGTLPSGVGSVMASVGFVVTPQVRQELLTEAIRRDPSLAGVSDPEGFKRLSDLMATLEEEYRLKHELEQLRSAQEAAAAQERRASEAAEQQTRLEAQRSRLAEEDRLRRERIAAAERERLAAMNPLARWIAVHRKGVIAAALSIASVILLTTGWTLVRPALTVGAADQPTPAGASASAASELDGTYRYETTVTKSNHPDTPTGDIGTPTEWTIKTICQSGGCATSAAIAGYDEPLMLRASGDGFQTTEVWMGDCQASSGRQVPIETTRDLHVTSRASGLVRELTGVSRQRQLSKCPDQSSELADVSYEVTMIRQQ